MEPIGSRETSVSNHRTPYNDPEDGSIHFNSDGSLRSRGENAIFVFYPEGGVSRSLRNVSKLVDSRPVLHEHPA
jgi:hypothetical protein